MKTKHHRLIKRKNHWTVGMWIFSLLILFILILTGNTFLLANKHTPTPTNSPAKNGERACAQVIVQAKNPKTGACETFGTPCAVPTGWKSCTTIQK